MLPEWFLIFEVSVFGLIIGSFLNVVIYRLHTGKSLNNRSHCLSCGRTLSWYELFPVFSYLVLRGRCRACHSFIPYRYILVEVLTAVLFVMAFLHFDNWTRFLLECIFLSVLIVVLVYDLYHKIIPDELSVVLGILAIIIVVFDSWRLGSGLYFGAALLAGFLPALGFFTIWFFSHGRAMGLGDAKLAFSLGILLGLENIFSFAVLSFWLGALVGVFLILLSTRLRKLRIFGRRAYVNMKSELPFAPFLILSFILVYFFEINIIQWLSTAALYLV